MTIKILDNALAYVGEIDNYETFIPTLVHGGQSVATITVDADANNAEYLVKGNYFYDPADLKHLFIITDEPKEYDEQGDMLNIIGYDVFWIFAGRAANTSTTPLTYTSKTTEYVAKDLIDRALVSATDTDRIVSLINVEANADKGSTINATVLQTPLDQEVKKLLAMDGLGLYGAIDLATAKIDVDVYEGADRTAANTDGNAPVIFDIDYDNITSGEEKDSNANVRNFAYVLGQDANGSRVIEAYGSASGISRREVIVDGGNTSDATELQAIGKAALITVEKGITVNADALDGPFIYDEDFTLGDIVTVMGEALRVLVARKVYQEGAADKLYITFGQKIVTTESQVESNTARISSLEAKAIPQGDVTGPASSTDGNLAAFDGTSGKALKDSGINTSKVPIAILRRDNNTFNTVLNQCIKQGWGYIQGDNTSRTMTEQVSFDESFDSVPIVIVSIIGGAAHAASDIESFTTGVDVSASTEDISVSSFKVRLSRISTDGNAPSVFSDSADYGYSWLAIGTIAR
jgi:hypothetical protein